MMLECGNRGHPDTGGRVSPRLVERAQWSVLNFRDHGDIAFFIQNRVGAASHPCDIAIIHQLAQRVGIGATPDRQRPCACAKANHCDKYDLQFAEAVANFWARDEPFASGIFGTCGINLFH